MKKVLIIVAMLTLSIFLVACGDQQKSQTNLTGYDIVEETAAKGDKEEMQENQNDGVTDENTTTDMVESVTTETTTESKSKSNTIVVYFSATGHTKEIAEIIADGMQAELYEIVPKEPYTDEDLNYNDSNGRCTLEMNDSSARPEISGTIDDFEECATVFIGYPIWWGEAPRILDTFVESYDFTGKTIIPFCTSASSGVGSSAQILESLAGSGNWVDGQRFDGNASADEVMEWAEQFR